MSRHPHSLKRLKKHRERKVFLLQLFSEKFTELTPENYPEIFRQVDDRLLEHYKSNIRSYQIARIEFAKYIKRFNRSSNQNYPVPAAPVRYERSLPLQNIETLKHGKKVTQFAKNLIAHWTEHNDNFQCTFVHKYHGQALFIYEKYCYNMAHYCCWPMVSVASVFF